MVAKTGSAVLQPTIQERSASVLFDPNSSDIFSPVFEVMDAPVILRAYNIVSDSAKLYMVCEAGNDIRQPVFKSGVQPTLSDTNTVLIVSESGRYQLEYIGSLGTATITKNVQAVG